MLAESNDVVASNNNFIAPQGLRSEIFSGNIAPENDVDLYQFQLNAGEGITIDVDGNEFDSDLDSVLRLFDESGNELATNDDNPAPGEVFTLDSYLTYIANTPGNYYVGVSDVSNIDYDLFEIEDDRNDIDNDNSRNYELELNIVEVVAEADADDTISEAIATGLNSPGDSDTFTDEIEVGRDIDIYQLELDAGDGLSLDIDAAEIDSDLDSQLRLFDVNGNELASSDDNPAPEEIFSSDSYISYTAEADGEYYVGVSTAGNADYDAINGRTNLFENDSTNSGSYDLNIDIVTVEADSDPDNTIAEANKLEIQNSLTIEDSVSPQGDVDVFELNLAAKETVTINLDAAKLDTGLDTALLLFDESGNEIERNDDGAAPGEDFATIDSYLEFTADSPGTYYVGVSGFPNVDYDVIDGRDNLGFDAETFSVGDYELIINSLDNLIGTDESDVLNGNSSSTLVRGLQGDDLVTGGENSDYLLGDSGNDVLSGNNGRDTLIGGTGNDSLSGGEDRDVLQGDNGNDKLRGGASADIFVLDETHLTDDTIVDFEVGIDKILLVNNTDFVELKIEDFSSGIGVTLSTTDGRAIAQILDISKNDLSEADFVTDANGSIIE